MQSTTYNNGANRPYSSTQSIHPSRSNDDVYIGMTLMDPTNQTYSIPAWKKSDAFLRDHPQVKIEKGFDGTGNLLVAENFKYLYETYGGSMNLVTGDGGFDFSTDFDHQEVNVLPLLYAQIACAVCMQARGGSFVLKIFDLFTTPTIDLLALLSSLYDHVSLIKPVTSRYANSEKYVVCTGFRLDRTELAALFDVLYRNFYTICCPSAFYLHVAPTHSVRHPYSMYMHRMLAVHAVPCGFIHAVAEYNTIIVQQQIENIHFTINLIRENEREGDPPAEHAWDTTSYTSCSISGNGGNVIGSNRPKIVNRKIQILLRNHTQKCIQWCMKHRLPYHNI